MSESERLEERLAAIRVGIDEVRAELDRLNINCERPNCQHKAVGPYVVSRYVVLLCDPDIADLDGSSTTWRNHMRQLIILDCEQRFMQSQVPVYVPPEKRVARDDSPEKEAPEIGPIND